MAHNTGSIQAVVFDLDGVLMDSEWIAFQAWKEVVATYGADLRDHHFPGLIGMTQERTAEYIMEHTGTQFSVSESSERTWVRTMEMLRNEVEPLPGVVELLQALRQRGVRTAIASNSFSGYIDNALASLHLGSYFTVRVGIDAVTHGKPAPDVYLLASEKLGVPPGQCVAIEDSRVGVRAAAAAGMRVLAVPDQRIANNNDGFVGAWRLYPSLVEVVKNLNSILE